jgi:hypothetical protein
VKVMILRKIQRQVYARQVRNAQYVWISSKHPWYAYSSSKKFRSLTAIRSTGRKEMTFTPPSTHSAKNASRPGAAGTLLAQSAVVVLII